MLHRFNRTVEAVDHALSRYRLNEALSHIYDLFWKDYCDWYLELIKPPYGEKLDEDKLALAIDIYERMLLLLHPFMPFITEELWWKVRPRQEGETIMTAAWPTRSEEHTSELQSRGHLVCRLLLDKKNETK